MLHFSTVWCAAAFPTLPPVAPLLPPQLPPLLLPVAQAPSNLCYLGHVRHLAAPAGWGWQVQQATATREWQGVTWHHQQVPQQQVAL